MWKYNLFNIGDVVAHKDAPLMEFQVQYVMVGVPETATNYMYQCKQLHQKKKKSVYNYIENDLSLVRKAKPQEIIRLLKEAIAKEEYEAARDIQLVLDKMTGKVAVQDGDVRALAFHEAGHALACIHYGIRFQYVTITESEKSLGYVVLRKMKLPVDIEVTPALRIKAEKYISSCLAGPIAEAKFTGASNAVLGTKDYQDAFEMAFRLFGSSKVVNAFINFIELDTEALFTYSFEGEGEPNEETDTDIWAKVTRLASTLTEKRKLIYKDVIDLIEK